MCLPWLIQSQPTQIKKTRPRLFYLNKTTSKTNPESPNSQGSYFMRCGGDNWIRSRSKARLRRHAPQTGASDDSRSSAFDMVKSVQSTHSNPYYETKKNDTRSFLLVEIIGFEPMTPCLQGRCSSQLSHTPKNECFVILSNKIFYVNNFSKIFTIISYMGNYFMLKNCFSYVKINLKRKDNDKKT